MKTKTLQVVDLFCGAGGTSTGILKAAARIKRKITLTAVNHWQTAINTHQLNHPNVRHICESVENIQPRVIVPSGYLDLLAASCECTFFSLARGGGPCNEQSRSQAWQIIRWATEIHVQNIMMENVKEFRSWGPLLRRSLKWKGKVYKKHSPDPRKRGHFFHSFIKALENLDYIVEHKIQNAADFGDATSRQRFILMARKKIAVPWPEKSHGPDAKKPWRVARQCIDWKLKGTSIWERKKPLCKNTLRRIEAGLKKFGGKNAEPFLVMLNGTAEGQIAGSAKSLDQPLPAVAGAGSHFHLCEPFITAYHAGKSKNNDNRNNSVNEPLPTQDTQNRFALVEPFVTHLTHHGDDAARCHSLEKPLPTVTGAHRGELALIEPFLLPPEQFKRVDDARSLKKPLNTITASRGRAFQLVEPILVQTDQTGGNGAYTKSVDSPLGTVVSKQNLLLVEPILVKYYSAGLGAHSVNEPLDTVTTRDRFMLVEFESRKPIAELDIRTRMLQPHELGAAHSFPKSYKFTGTKGDQTKQIGNSVPVELAAAHARAILS